MYKKYFSEHIYYFIIFIIVSVIFIVNGYAALGTNDDWALRGMLVAEGIYGTLMMSYPLSYIVSHLYDFFPSFPWYSSLLTLVLGLNFYFIALYIAKNDSYIQKAIVFVLAVLWLTFILFNITITGLTVITMISAVGLIRNNLIISFLFILLASLLRTEIMFISLPYYIVAFFILRNQLIINKSEVLTLIGVIILIGASLFVKKQDHFYNNWLEFNKARAAIVDMGILNVEKDYFSVVEKFCYQAGWLQDPQLLSTEKLIATTPTLSDILQANVQKINFVHFIKMYKFKHWLWLLLAVSCIIIILNIKSRKSLFIPIFAFGVILLLITRDVERVTVPMILLWAYVLSESLKSHRILNTLFLFLFTYIFYTYASGQLGYRYFKENTLLQQEAQQLIQDSNKICEVSINYPTDFSHQLNTVFQANYLFHEGNWIQINEKGILPGGWLVRHEFFYKSHNLSDPDTTRKYATYYDYLIDDKTAFFGSRVLAKSGNFNILLNAYDQKYLKNRPNCKHKTFIIAESKHFAISQIKVDCKL
jgi:hypothetical protein